MSAETRGCPPRLGNVRRDTGCPLRLGMSAETRGCPLARPEATDDVAVVVHTATVVEYLIRYTRFMTAILILTIFRPDISDICARKQFKYEYNVYLLILVKFFRNRRQVNVLAECITLQNINSAMFLMLLTLLQYIS